MMRKIRRKGAFFVEYALILAMIAVLGVAFLYNNDSTGHNVKSIINDTGRLLGKAVGIEFEEEEGTDTSASNNVISTIGLKPEEFKLGTFLVEEVDSNDNMTISVETNKEPNQVTGNEDFTKIGYDKLLNLEANSAYQPSINTASLSGLDGTTITISSYYADDKGNTKYNGDSEASAIKTFKFNGTEYAEYDVQKGYITDSNGKAKTLNDYTINTNSNSNQYTYVSLGKVDSLGKQQALSATEAQQYANTIGSNLVLNKIK